MPWTEYKRFNGYEEATGVSNVTSLYGNNTGTVTFSDTGDTVLLKTPYISEDIPEGSYISGIDVRTRYQATTGAGGAFSVSVQKFSGLIYENIGVSSNISTTSTDLFTTSTPDSTTNLLGKGFTRSNIDNIIGLKYTYTSGEFNLHGETSIALPAIRIYHLPFQNKFHVLDTSKVSITGGSQLTIN